MTEWEPRPQGVGPRAFNPPPLTQHRAHTVKPGWGNPVCADHPSGQRGARTPAANRGQHPATPCFIAQRRGSCVLAAGLGVQTSGGNGRRDNAANGGLVSSVRAK